MRSYFLVWATMLALPVAVLAQPNGFNEGGQPANQPRQPRQGFNQPGNNFNNPPGNAGQGANDPAFMQQVSYGLGRNWALNLKENGIDVDLQALMAGIGDALRGVQPRWSDQQLEQTLTQFDKQMQQKMMTEMQQLGEKNHREAENFLAQNGRQQGVQTTPSGLQYRVLKQGSGPSPTLNDRVKCNYRGTLLNGTEFDSSSKHGGAAEFGVNEVIPGWTEALQKMHVGDKWQLFVPPKLAYDMRPPRAPIEPGSLLVFEIELLDVAKK